MNKKGLELFSAMISIFTLIALCFAAYSLIFNPKFSGQERIIAERAFAVFDLDQKARVQEFMREEGLKYASYNALVGFGEKGGNCEDWSSCKPDLDKFKDYVKGEYLKILKNLGVRAVERENYMVDIRIENNSFAVSAIAKEKMFFSDKGVFYRYKLEPLSKEIDYDLNIYNVLYNKLYALRANTDISILLLSKCPTKEELFGDLNIKFKCDVLSKENYIKFEVTQELLFVKPTISFKVQMLGKPKLK